MVSESVISRSINCSNVGWFKQSIHFAINLLLGQRCCWRSGKHIAACGDLDRLTS
jgi:hypothetical protein